MKTILIESCEDFNLLIEEPVNKQFDLLVIQPQKNSRYRVETYFQELHARDAANKIMNFYIVAKPHGFRFDQGWFRKGNKEINIGIILDSSNDTKAYEKLVSYH